jgi:DsbC/DsbD-like thiol-disulfide interchange protein
MFGLLRFTIHAAAAGLAAMPLLCLQIALPARADDASPWDKGMHSAVRLIAASARRGGDHARLRAGVEMRLDRGWKTYWRYPGDSGVPPRFDFTRSENVKSVSVKWPAPHRFSDDGGQSIGYTERVIFPLDIEPQDAAKPVMLRLDLDYAVCEKLCVPAEANAELMVVGDRTPQEAALKAAEERVPQRRLLGEGKDLSIRAVQREGSARVVVDLTAPHGASVELFAEGPSPDWALPLPAPVAAAPAGTSRFTFALDGLPPGATAEGAVLTLTAIAGENAIEVSHRLD